MLGWWSEWGRGGGGGAGGGGHGSGKRRDKRSSICGICSGAFERTRARGSDWPAARLLHGSDTAGRAQECGTDGRQDGSGADGSAAPVAAAFCRRRELVG